MLKIDENIWMMNAWRKYIVDIDDPMCNKDPLKQHRDDSYEIDGNVQEEFSRPIDELSR